MEIERDQKKKKKANEKSLEIILGYSTETEHFRKETDSMSSWSFETRNGSWMLVFLNAVIHDFTTYIISLLISFFFT